MTGALNISLMMEQQNASVTDAVNKYFRRVFNFIRSRVSELEDAEDIVQDVFYELTEKVRLSEHVEETAPWLLRVARNKIIDSRRKKKTEPLPGIKADEHSDETQIYFLDELIESDMANPDALLDNDLLLFSINEALNELPVEQREVFMLHEMQNKSFREISDATGVPVNTLLSRKRYAVLHLRKRLSNLYNELYN